MSRELIDRSRGRWRDILSRSGIAETFLKPKQGPCPICGGKTRFRFDDKNGSGSWICNACGSGYGIHLIQKVLGLSMSDALSTIERLVEVSVVEPTPAKTSGRDPLVAARDVWESAIKGTGEVVRYLTARGISESIIGGVSSVRGVDRLLYLDEDGNFCGRMPGMVSIIQSAGGKPAGIHRTFLTADGQQAPVPSPKKILGSLPEGAAVRLSRPAPIMGIAEGIETALSAFQMFDVPTWAGLTANGLEKWQPPGDAREVHIFGDQDFSFTGQAAAFVLARRLRSKGLIVHVRLPEKPGTDWNDVLKETL